ncbi:hypothetical protein BDW66DRAFT_163349 [Aspergillus desertorum]
MSTQRIYIDHLLLQFSQEQFDLIPTWISDKFTLIDGGVHTGLSRRARLTITNSARWLEPKQAHSVQRRDLAGEPGDGRIGVTYLPPEEGGRKNSRGVDIRWKIVKAGYYAERIIPRDEFYPRERTDAPFFRHDLSHPTQAAATGIEVLVPRDRFHAYTDLCLFIVGASPREDESRAEFKLSAPDISSFPADEQFLPGKGVGLRSETGRPFSFPISITFSDGRARGYKAVRSGFGCR